MVITGIVATAAADLWQQALKRGAGAASITAKGMARSDIVTCPDLVRLSWTA